MDIKIVGINDIHCYLLLEESKGQGVLLESMTFIVIYSLSSPKGRESNVWLAKRFLNVKGLT